MSGHTPPPWVIVTTEEQRQRSAGIRIDIDDPDGSAIAFAWGTNAEAMDNARLIAAAPEMFGALTSLVGIADANFNTANDRMIAWQCALKHARAALAKATPPAASSGLPEAQQSE